jgi:hypothetical protein
MQNQARELSHLSTRDAKHNIAVNGCHSVHPYIRGTLHLAPYRKQHSITGVL